VEILRYHFLQPILEALALFGLITVSLLRRKSADRKRPTAFFRWFLLARRRPWIAFLLVGLLAFSASALLTVFAGIPQPCVHDEFSYLLAADTFAHGRLANPTHPLWKHFETFHVIQHPTYASKYPPAQGITLALGQVIFGHPIIGVWLSVGLACAAICWMLAGWCSLPWAWIGGLVALVGLVFSRPWNVLNLGLGYAYWSQSYWGGAVAALGGALVFGALPRIMKKTRLRDALWLALGLAILANSRAFEGLVVSIPVAVVLIIWIFRNKCLSYRDKFYRLVLPVVLVLLITASWMSFYNFRVTGNPFLMPYHLHESSYAIASQFICKPLRPEPQYNHKTMYDFYRQERNYYSQLRTIKGWVYSSIKKIVKFCFFYFGIIFSPFIIYMTVSRTVSRQWNVMFPLGICALMMAALLAVTWSLPHYAAPVACLVFLLVVESLRQARRLIWRGKPIGKRLVRGVLPMYLVSAILSFPVAHHLQQKQPLVAWSMDRARILWELEQDNERHLVIVRYDSNHDAGNEWVYNKADIDGAKVVWARDMGPESNKDLLDYFKGRHVWLLEPSKLHRKFKAYPMVSP